MPLAPEYYTADMVRALPDDGNRYELVHGELLETLTSPADISWGSDTLVQPDVFVVPKSEAITGDWTRMRSLVLVAEVLSPTTARLDRFQKRKLYQQQRVSTLWLVDVDRRLVEVWSPDARFPVIETERVTWHAAGATQPLVIEIAELLRET